MFEMEKSRIKQFAAKAKKHEATFLSASRPLKLNGVFDFPGKDAKTAAEVAAKLNKKRLTAILKLDEDVQHLGKLYRATQATIEQEWDRHVKKKKKEAAQILKDLVHEKIAIFKDPNFHPGCKTSLLSDKNRKLVKEAIKKVK